MESKRTDPSTPQSPLASCPNCGASRSDDSDPRFCPDCGQDNSHARLQARSILLDSLHNFVGWDSALLRTLRGLLTGPGKLVTQYVGGKRRAFVNPARFCLLSLALWFLVLNLAGIDALESSGFEINDGSKDAATGETVQEIRQFLARHLEILQYLALPFLALILKRLFRKSGRNLAECLVLVLYLVGFRYLASTLVLPLQMVLESSTAIARLVFGIAWFTWAARDFFNVGWWSAIWRVIVAFIVHMLSTVIFFASIALPWVLLN